LSRLEFNFGDQQLSDITSKPENSKLSFTMVLSLASNSQGIESTAFVQLAWDPICG
jgi:hypothetical protein